MPDGDIQALVQLVERLGAECPWTKQQDCHDMIYYTRKELLEVEDVFRGASKGRGSVDAADLTKELGDVLFDALMMIEVTRRNHSQVSINACAASALDKLRRRAPYMFDGKGASSIEEAEAGWQAAKQAERDAEKASAAAASAERQSGVAAAPANSVPAEGAQADALQSTRKPPSSRPPQGHQTPALAEPARAAPPGDVLSESDDDGGLAEWESDFKKAAGPPSEDEDSGED